MIIAIALVLAMAAFSFVALPFFRQKVHPAAPAVDDGSQELLFKRDTIFSMLKELEFDYQSGILADKDYRELEERYKKKGIAILKDMDGLANDAEIDEAIEKHISQVRKGKASSVEDEIEEQVARLRKKGVSSAPDDIKRKVSELRQKKGPSADGTEAPGAGQFCTQCGAKRQAEGRFCAQCGAKLS
ncbi:MAG: hypothetical protein HYX84_08725 [Chloroflexi bacterium]|nr:hypothetical protein [Chloroflexota bacterium]